MSKTALNRFCATLHATFRALLVCFSVIGASATIVRAAEAPDAAKPIAFPKGTFTLSSDVAFAATMGAHNASVPSLQLAGSYYIFDNVSLGAEATGCGVLQPGEDAAAVSLALLVRHHLFQWDDFTFFGDVSFGPFEASEETPQSGTHFNFATRTGVGLTYQLDERLHLLFGSRYFHLSNARIHGVERNPSFNGVECYIGLMWSM